MVFVYRLNRRMVGIYHPFLPNRHQGHTEIRPSPILQSQRILLDILSWVSQTGILLALALRLDRHHQRIGAEKRVR